MANRRPWSPRALGRLGRAPIEQRHGSETQLKDVTLIDYPDDWRLAAVIPGLARQGSLADLLASAGKNFRSRPFRRVAQARFLKAMMPRTNC